MAQVASRITPLVYRVHTIETGTTEARFKPLDANVLIDNGKNYNKQFYKSRYKLLKIRNMA